MKDLVCEWIDFLSMTVSPRTVEVYQYHVWRLLATAPGRKISEWTPAHLLGYMAARRAAGNGESILKQAVAAFRSFFRYTSGNTSPAVGLPYPRVKRKKQRTLDSDSALRVLASCDTTTVKGTRDLALLTLMLDTGLRASEVCRLKTKNVDLEKRRLKVIVKGGNEETAVFSRLTTANLGRWLSVRDGIAKAECETFFVSVGGLKPGDSLTAIGLRSVLGPIGKRAGLEKFTPHDLRRTFATIAIRAGAPTRVVQAAGRWGDLAMVEHYTSEINAEDMDRYSPVEALMKGQE